MNADNIIVIDNGNIVGVDKHEKLLKTCTVYQEIYNSQNKTEDEEKEESKKGGNK